MEHTVAYELDGKVQELKIEIPEEKIETGHEVELEKCLQCEMRDECKQFTDFLKLHDVELEVLESTEDHGILKVSGDPDKLRAFEKAIGADNIKFKTSGDMMKKLYVTKIGESETVNITSLLEEKYDNDIVKIFLSALDGNIYNILHEASMPDSPKDCYIKACHMIYDVFEKSMIPVIGESNTKELVYEFNQKLNTELKKLNQQ